MNPSPLDELNLVLSQSDLYPPLQGQSPAIVGFSTGIPAPAILTFDITVNGQSSGFEGISLNVGVNAGTLWVRREFIASYPGAWPVAVELRAHQDGQQVGSAILRLHDTRAMVVHSAEVGLFPNPASVPPAAELRILTRATFFDAQGVELPDAEVSWAVRLPEPVPGVVLDGTRIVVSPEAQVGDVTVVVSESSGLVCTTNLTLTPARDIGLEFRPNGLYPPLLSEVKNFMYIGAELPFEEGVGIKVTLNGVGGTHDGIMLVPREDDWVLEVWPGFVTSYPGQWPIEVSALASQDGQIIGSATGWLYDTRTVVCAKVDLVFSPGDTVEIPQEGEALVRANGRFYDENGVRISHEEVKWGAQMVDPMEGVTMIKHQLFIGPNAKPGKYRIAIIGPNGLNRAKVLTLV
ncbi:hypothetical protein [Pseudomonas sp. zfem002]|uniref:hypothetical protein n=1 Tax=Pseudomonas sp. zfem002 TaxID=3078197 RepID=UPI0029277971|nr:hypothetical protein [Pseudomonas sp. zfem002]MDU9394816.1 hypothetical protein [Pseudomonas sp. zfem002]